MAVPAIRLRQPKFISNPVNPPSPPTLTLHPDPTMAVPAITLRRPKFILNSVNSSTMAAPAIRLRQPSFIPNPVNHLNPITMAVPAIRLWQPKCIPDPINPLKSLLLTEVHLLITLKNSKKLVVSSDAYHGIVQSSDKYECVLCDATWESDIKLKEMHKCSQKHKSAMNGIPFCKEFSEDLVRQLTKNSMFCITCSSVVALSSITHHIMSNDHQCELSKALERSHFYKPSE